MLTVLVKYAIMVTLVTHEMNLVMPKKKKSDFEITHEVVKTPVSRYLRLELNRTKENCNELLTKMLELCKADFQYNTSYGSSVWFIQFDDRIQYGQSLHLCVDVFYTKFREYMKYEPSLDDLDLQSKLHYDGEHICLSWRRDELENLLSVCRFRNGHTLRSFLLKCGFRADKGVLKIRPSVGICKMLQSKNFFNALPLTEEFKTLALQLSSHSTNKKKLAEEFRNTYLDVVEKLNGRKPLQHQLDYLSAVATEGSMLCCFDMGLGKTYTSLLQAHIYRTIMPSLKVYVITKASVIPQWYAENWSTVKVPIEVVSWAKIPEPKFDEPYIVIADESHFTQSMKSQRTGAYLRFCEMALAVINLTGTPFKNGRPEDAQAMLMAASVYAYSDFSAIKDLSAFREAYGKYFFYRHKDECLDLPEKTHIEHQVEFSAQDVKRVEYAYHEFMVLYEQRAQQGLVSLQAAHLVALQQLRKLLAAGKTAYAIELVEDIVSSGEQCVVFCDFVEPLEKLEQHFGSDCVYLKASDSADKRYEKQSAFQAGKVKIFLSSYKCGGVGINLTPCTNMVCVDRPYTPADVVQAEDRIHRIGQRNAATIYWLYYLDQTGIEKWVEGILDNKQANINELLDYNYELR